MNSEQRRKERQGAGALGQPPEIELNETFNPFRNDNHFDGAYEILKIILLLPVMVVRLLVFVTSLLLGYLLTKLALFRATNVLTSPFPQWRRSLMLPVRLCARVNLFACGFHWIHLKGRPAPRHEAPILVSNHVTFADPLFLFFKHLPVIVTAYENLNLPIAGAIIKAMQAIAVDRISRTSRQNASDAIKRKAMCNDWSHVMIFPEATTTNGKLLISFKAGAFTPGFPVQPILIRYSYVHMDPCWVAEGPVIYWLLFRLMTQFHNFMSVEYLPIIYPNLAETKNPQMFAERVRLTMARAMNTSVTQHTFEDATLAMEAVRLNIDSGSALLEFGEFNKISPFRVKDAKRCLSKFLTMDSSKRGSLTFEDYIKAVNLPNCSLLQQVYRYFDRTNSGCISFRQVHLLFDRLDVKKGGILRLADFASYCDENPDFLLIFLIGKSSLL
ncbi:lysophospholipid acyltransferase LPEAT2 isoform X2 [Physcomitrium patens]|uniref:Phospholipid/glycerol acyltransferase domain-containing protein n=1 Tax=Physcomitrium patens TaxID=3218 RepID=A0A7I4DXE2_PHYPA|nr:lysophospholipid acyltransferase LPEAT2-like isoform X2 [Physcomitrium patens]|eukprot:XP_024379184.1 lysophospholipid acyltransferase LPEAT2-like isoform X2 [Physcomitrella patens]